MATEEEAPVKQGNKVAFIVDFRVHQIATDHAAEDEDTERKRPVTLLVSRIAAQAPEENG
ncbi:hypothetical protein RvY_01349 [Ramazzottius varieornatus]|uniref:Uncharacterized protein n=1 Tax=Ramazzottius varieornatus TaxID=947166 RepID=A0A1D1UN53_RAMVA|nr:hypothetical protein RvY_01349 [Ramazzottius varieornatus]